MANKADKPWQAPALPGACLPGSESVPPGHFIDEECTADQDSFLIIMTSRRAGRTMASLKAIFDRCRWEGTCLLWQGSDSGTGRGGGYGRIKYDGANFAVHRLVYQLVYGPISPRKQVDHSCNNRLCCNPDHLQHMTHKKNQKLRDKRRSEAKP